MQGCPGFGKFNVKTKKSIKFLPSITRPLFSLLLLQLWILSEWQNIHVVIVYRVYRKKSVIRHVVNWISHSTLKGVLHDTWPEKISAGENDGEECPATKCFILIVFCHPRTLCQLTDRRQYHHRPFQYENPQKRSIPLSKDF